MEFVSLLIMSFVPVILNEFSKLKLILTCELSRCQTKKSEGRFFNAVVRCNSLEIIYKIIRPSEIELG